MKFQELAKENPDLVPMVGMRTTITYLEPGIEDKKVFDRDFEVLARQLDKVELGDSLRPAKPFYEHALGVAMANLEKEPNTFEGVRCASTWGMKLFTPFDCGVITWGATMTSTLAAWEKDIALGAATNWGDILGTAAVPISPSSVADFKGVHAFHSLISYLPVAFLQQLYYEILGVPYSLFVVEPQVKGNSKIPAEVPLPGPFLILSTSSYYIGGCFDKGDPDIALAVRTAIGPLGLIFAEYNYLAQKLEA